jgi:hypothetical protein
MGKFFLIIIAISVAVLLAMSAYVISLWRRCGCQPPDPKAPDAKSATGTFVISWYRALDRVAQTIGQNLALTRSAHLRVARDAATAIAHGGCGGRESARCASLSQGGNGCVGGANERAQCLRQDLRRDFAEASISSTCPLDLSWHPLLTPCMRTLSSSPTGFSINH